MHGCLPHFLNTFSCSRESSGRHWIHIPISEACVVCETLTKPTKLRSGCVSLLITIVQLCGDGNIPRARTHRRFFADIALLHLIQLLSRNW